MDQCRCPFSLRSATPCATSARLKMMAPMARIAPTTTSAADLTHESLSIARAVLGLDLQSSDATAVYSSTNGTGHRYTHWFGEPLMTERSPAGAMAGPVERFWMANECDVALVAHANQRVRALAAVVHGNRGHGGKHVTNY